MLSDSELAGLLQAQYDCTQGIFDYKNRIGVVSYALKFYPDRTAILCEGSYNIPDWFSNIQFTMLYPSGYGGVEAGFFESIEDAAADIMPRIQAGKPIQIAGHSRGSPHANLIARALILKGIIPDMISRTTFGSPRPGDSTFANSLAGSPGVSYRNYHDFETQDFVCDVPLDVKILLPYVHVDKQTLVDVVPPDPDAWGILKMHHLSNYIKGLENGQLHPSV